MKQEFTSAGLNIPVSISDMPAGWQQSKDISSMVEAVDFFMINNFPYFAGNAKTGDSSQAWSDFTGSITYFQGIAKGKPLLVTQVSQMSFLLALCCGERESMTADNLCLPADRMAREHSGIRQAVRHK